MIRINDIIDKILDHNPDADVDLVNKAYIYSARVHDGQVRLSGEPYLSHPLEVANILAEMSPDCVSIAAGLLHDVIEDTHATPEEIGEMFGDEVRHIVDGVTKLSKIEAGSSEERHAGSIRKMILAMADDIRVILIKLADRIHNMRTLDFHPKESKRREISQETMDIYAPLASRLGIYWMKKELEDTAFKYLMPEEYERIRELFVKNRKQHEDYIESVRNFLKEKMEKADIPCEVSGRYKHIYSIFHKMQRQHLEFEDVYDVIAFRITLKSENPNDCYTVLGMIHGMWRPVGGKLKDYIGRNAKPNGYQSIHTTVFGGYGERAEIQIRNRQMDEVAKSGIAAHWKYKEGKPLDEELQDTFAWLRTLIENQENTEDPKEFLQNVRLDLFPEEVNVFTPGGDAKSLPKGSTPIDFAYHIHTEVGHKCTGAKVNGRIVPIRYELQTGDVVEILTTNGHHPSKDWLTFVKTVKAKNRIRQWIRAEDKERSINIGREICEKTFRKYKLGFNTLLKSAEMSDVIAEFGFKTSEDLLAAVGYGKITPLQLVRKFLPSDPESQTSGDKASEKKADDEDKTFIGSVAIGGMEDRGDMTIRFGKCCQPIPGDEIIAYITLGHGITVHRKDCATLIQMNPERLIPVDWKTSEDTYPVRIRIRSRDKVGLLAELTQHISTCDVNILSIASEVTPEKLVEATLTLAVKDRDHLKQVITAIKKIKEIIKVVRLDS